MSLQPEVVNLLHFKLRLFDLTEFIVLTSQVYHIRFHRYSNWKIRVFGNNSIPISLDMEVITLDSTLLLRILYTENMLTS